MPDQQPSPHRRTDRLTAVEKQILAGLAQGKIGARICRDLGISRSLYQVHLRMLRRYLEVETTVEAVAMWVRDRPEP